MLTDSTPRTEAFILCGFYFAVIAAVIGLIAYRHFLGDCQQHFLKIIFLLLLLTHSLLRCIFLLLSVFVTQHVLAGDFYNTFPAAVFTSICTMLLLQWIRAASSSFVPSLVFYVLVNLVVYVLLFALYGLQASLGGQWRVMLLFSVTFASAWLLLLLGVLWWSIRTHPWRDSVAECRAWHAKKRSILGGFWALSGCLLLRAALLLFSTLKYSNTVNLSAATGDIVTPTPLSIVLGYYIVGEVLPCFFILLVLDRLPVDFATTYGELQRLLQKLDANSGKGEIATTADKTLCKICFDKESNTVLLPCKHSCLCWDCAKDIQKQPKNQICPICKGFLEEVFLIYRS